MKRFIDLLISCLLLILLSPVFVVAALLVSFSGKGGVFYVQNRVGRYNRDFGMLKFRTMVADAHQKGLLTVGERDPRITSVGYWLRKYKLDELPQLLNVVAGQMSLVGPRPEVRAFVALYTEEQLKVLSVRPGITDPASIEFINENELLGQSVNPQRTYIEEVMPRKLQINLEYIQKATWITDLKILFQTLTAIAR